MKKLLFIIFLSIIVLIGGCRKNKILPVADFSANQMVGVAPLEVSFSDESNYNPVSWEWNFGDGSTSSERNPSHTFNSEGYFSVTLKVTNQDGEDITEKSRFILIDNSLGQPCPEMPSFIYNSRWYNTVLIGTQCWMKENLNYATGTSYCYELNVVNCSYYGRLYDWHTVMKGEPSSNSVPSGVQGICPDGWHVPSDAEWKILEGYVDIQIGVGHNEWDKISWRGFYAGRRLKAITGWHSNTGTDPFGFKARPAGYGGAPTPYWQNIKRATSYWTSTQEGNSKAFTRLLSHDDDQIARSSNDKIQYRSLRCIKD